MENKIRINVLSKADSVPAQGVGSAYLEQTSLIKNISSLDVSINSKKNNFDIYHIHSVNPSLRLRMNKKHINIMYVHFIPSHNEGSIKLPKLIEKIFIKYVNNMYKAADELVVVNPSFIPYLIELGIEKEKITYIPNYVDTSNFHKINDSKKVNKIREKYGVKSNDFVVLGVGQVQTRKGVIDFIETAKRNPSITFIWTGGFSFGKITDGYKELKSQLDNPPINVKFLGIISRNEMNDIYNISNCLFMPSFIELFPMAILEASRVSLPILLRDIELYKPILEGKYLSGSNVDEFSEQLNILINDKDLYKKYSDLSNDISLMYSKEKVSSQWERYYHDIYNKYKSN